jgi:prepilin signal peptidase PulO-like enzyme (type II secretory pathway)
MFELFFFVLGAIVASFAGVVACRLHTGQSFVRGRSRCDVCNAELRPAALIPCLSYFAFLGRARCCGANISFLAPVSEIVLGGLFVYAYRTIGFDAALPFFLLSLSLLAILVLYDLAHQILPPKLLGAFLGVSAISGFLRAPTLDIWYQEVLIAFCVGAFLALIHVLSRGRAMGFADAPFVFALALLIGPHAFSGFIFSFWIGAVIGIVILLRRPRGSRMGVEVPFAPFLAAGFILALTTQWNPFTLLAALL